ncbi:MAG: putatative transmembrane protein [Burkholderiaceae bacterium]|jgi:uncharacterized protein (DUF924 family)|nr:MAG: putatative transmembrane protein [Burkholderiaceae bacterium]
MAEIPAAPPAGELADPRHARAILDYWFADGLVLGWPSRDLDPLWFGGTEQQDREIRDRFGPWVDSAIDGGLRDWENEPGGEQPDGPMPGWRWLALILLLDQFSRNLHRGTARAFAGDARAQRLVGDMLAQRADEQLPWVARVFVYMPLMHAEDAALQRECVRRFEALEAAVPENLRPSITGSLKFARTHLEIIGRFGRFPYRNAALGRSSSAAELEFLKTGPRFGQ